MRLPHCVAIFYNLPWFCSIKVSNKKLQHNAENASGSRMCKCTFREGKFVCFWYRLKQKMVLKNPKYNIIQERETYFFSMYKNLPLMSEVY
jgi:hypothetical protein